MRVIRKAVFHFGPLLFGLDFTSASLMPLESRPPLREWPAQMQLSWLRTVPGIVFSAIVHSGLARMVSNVTIALFYLLAIAQGTALVRGRCLVSHQHSAGAGSRMSISVGETR